MLQRDNTSLKEQEKRLWKLLNKKHGIYTKEQLIKEMKNTKLDIGIFTSPIKRG